MSPEIIKKSIMNLFIAINNNFMCVFTFYKCNCNIFFVRKIKKEEKAKKKFVTYRRLKYLLITIISLLLLFFSSSLVTNNSNN